MKNPRFLFNGSSHAMHSGSAVVRFGRCGMILAAPHLQKDPGYFMQIRQIQRLHGEIFL